MCLFCPRLAKLSACMCLSGFISGCASVVAVVDTATSTAIYAGKTAIGVIDAITPDIINKDE